MIMPLQLHPTPSRTFQPFQLFQTIGTDPPPQPKLSLTVCTCSNFEPLSTRCPDGIVSLSLPRLESTMRLSLAMPSLGNLQLSTP